jgi:predicted TIM-barrel fold metal-dependent hydrolase
VPANLSRRDFLRATTAAAAVTSGWTAGPLAAGEPSPASSRSAGNGLVDVNVTLSRWPFRHLPLDETPKLVARLRRCGVTRACVGSFDSLLHKDMGEVNARLAEACLRHGRGLLVPFGSVNPQLPDWEEELRRCQEQFHMPGLRLYPNYHGYALDDPRVTKLLDLAQAFGLTVQLALSMEDERTQHPLVRVPHVNATPLLTLLTARPQVRVVLLNWFRAVNGELLPKLARAGQVYFDIAMVEGVGGISNLLKQVPANRVVFGSHAPFFYFESALLKLKESALSGAELSAIRFANAQRALWG